MRSESDPPGEGYSYNGNPWDSSFGRGRRGWRIECTAMALEYLGGAFDVQGGGSDLVFPAGDLCR